MTSIILRIRNLDEITARDIQELLELELVGVIKEEDYVMQIIKDPA